MMDVESVASVAIESGLRLHRHLGPGLLESVYESLLAATLARGGFSVERQVPVTITYDGLTLKDAFRADLLIESNLIIEVKSVDKLAPIHSKQLLTYLRVSNRPLGLLMNVGGMTFKEGLKRVVNAHHGASSLLRVNAQPA
ncbi:GxxExxY protein [Sphingosinicella sp. BN140058]|uniref:GxxExxY protein n=1 Tax=Sphingosinicella sp. BN140058 TaxID=1892855 RepID=UPI0010112F68|nr:GxxExxY protein [Sphingosinicella sp. BN140058]QAY75139.1 GxxExxY protein [Sphingosinicella sp. BN140058]